VRTCSCTDHVLSAATGTKSTKVDIDPSNCYSNPHKLDADRKGRKLKHQPAGPCQNLIFIPKSPPQRDEAATAPVQTPAPHRLPTPHRR
jgi:hypothetical protein